MSEKDVFYRWNACACAQQFFKSLKALFFFSHFVWNNAETFNRAPRVLAFRNASMTTLTICSNCAKKYAVREIHEWKYPETTRGRNASRLITSVSAHIFIYKSWRLRKVTLAFSINFSIHVFIFIVSSYFLTGFAAYSIENCHSLVLFNNIPPHSRATLLR